MTAISGHLAPDLSEKINSIWVGAHSSEATVLEQYRNCIELHGTTINSNLANSTRATVTGNQRDELLKNGKDLRKCIEQGVVADSHACISAL